jgi:hypothetical protein
MTTFTGLFKESSSKLGVFYPTYYIIATFQSFEKAREAEQAVRKLGIGDDEMASVPADEMLTFFEEFRANSGVWSGVMTMLSRGFGTEQVFADDDIDSALKGAGFLAIHSKEEELTKRLQALIAPFQPITMHWYAPGGVHLLV